MSTISPIHLLKLFTVRENFELYRKYVQNEILPNDAVLLLTDYAKYFSTFPDKTEIDFSQFVTLFQTDWHSTGMNVEQHNNFQILFSKLESLSQSSAKECLPAFFSAETKEKISAVLHPLDPEKIREELENYERKLSVLDGYKDPDVYGIDDVDFKALNKDTGLAWCLPSMNEAMGCLIKGDFIVIGAGVNVGKSAFCLTQAAFTYKYLYKNKIPGPILYFNTEGTLDTVWARFLVLLFRQKLGYSLNQIIEKKDEVIERFKKGDPSLFVGFDAAGKDWRYIASKMEQFKPSLVIVDMLDDLKTEGKGDDTRADKGLYARMRWLSNKHCAILATCQAKGSGKYYDSESHTYKSKHWLELNELDWSNVGKQAKAESVVLIGCDDNFPNDRYINVAKVKRGQVGHLPVVQFNSQFANYEEIEDIKL